MPQLLRRALLGVGALAVVSAGLLAQSRPPAVTAKALRAAEAAEWLSYGRDQAETHYSPLTQVSTTTVAGLARAWSTQLGVPGTLETTPLVSNGVLYATGPWSTVFALDARTGDMKWTWDPKLPTTGGPRLCCGAVNRGVALYNGLVFVGLLDGRLVALNAGTGMPVWDVQTSVDLKESYSITGAPRVVKGKVIIGNGGAENAVRGYISAYDAMTGRLAWRFFTVPGDPSKPFEHPELEAAAKTWTGEWWKYGGGGTAWDAMAYDADADLLYVGTGNAGPWDRNFRSPQGGDNLFVASILALKPDTGRLAWHFQQVPGDQWDYTATQPMTLADLRIGGRTRKVLLQAPKNGFFYVLDRLTGRFISGEPFTMTNWATRLETTTGRPVETPQARYGLTPVTITPGPPGAHNWQPMSFHPGTGLVYFPVRVNAFQYSIDPAYKYNKGGRNLGVIAGPGALPRVGGEEAATASSFLLAWDPVAQKERWRVNFTGAGTGSGTLATGGMLVFEADPQGTLVAYHAGTGARLWSAPVGSGAATPISYELGGRQYIAIAGGRGGDDPGRITTFALPASSSSEDPMTPSTTMPSSVLDRTRALLPQLRESAAATEQARRVLPETFDALSAAGIFRMTAPRKWGGDEVDLQTQCEVLAEVARACPSSSWVATIFSAMSWLAGTYPDQAQEEIFAGGDPRISGVFSPTGTAVRKDGGFVVNGKWGFNTGGQGSNWTVLNTILTEGDGLPLCVIAPTRELERLDDWNATGMAGTGSHTVLAKNVFVPEYRAVPLPYLVEGKGAPNRHTASNPYFNLPLAPVLIVNGGGTPLGTARGAFDTFMERLPGRPIAYTYYTNRAEAAVTHLQVGEASLLVDSCDAHVRLACALLDGPAATSLSVHDRVRSRAHITYATGLARQAVDILFNASGASSIQPHIPIQRFQRDIQALANHAVMHTQTGTELYGRVLCGLEPNTPLY